MKSIFLSLVFFSLVVSCQKPPATEPANEATIQLKVDGALKQYREIAAVRIDGSLGQHTYSFVATKDPSSVNYFTIILTTDSLRVGTYTIKKEGIAAFREGDKIATNLNGQGLTVEILKNDGGRVSARFSGTLYNQSNNSISQVIEGEISGVQLRYKR